MSDVRFRQVSPGVFTTEPCAASGCDEAGVVRVSLPIRDRVTPRAVYTCRAHEPTGDARYTKKATPVPDRTTKSQTPRRSLEGMRASAYTHGWRNSEGHSLGPWSEDPLDPHHGQLGGECPLGFCDGACTHAQDEVDEVDEVDEGNGTPVPPAEGADRG